MAGHRVGRRRHPAVRGNRGSSCRRQAFRAVVRRVPSERMDGDSAARPRATLRQISEGFPYGVFPTGMSLLSIRDTPIASSRSSSSPTRRMPRRRHGIAHAEVVPEPTAAAGICLPQGRSWSTRGSLVRSAMAVLAAVAISSYRSDSRCPPRYSRCA